MSENLAICVLGNQDSGKSHTWNTMFNRTVRTGNELRRLYFDNGEYVEIFLVSGSSEERHVYIGDIITVKTARIVLCSMQYRDDVIKTIKYFAEHDFFLFVHWLNPGHKDSAQVDDILGLIFQLLLHDSVIGIRNGQIDANNRVKEMRDFIYGWASSRNLVKHE